MDLSSYAMVLTPAVTVPVIIGIVQAIKETNVVADRFLPLVSIAVGICAGMYLDLAHPLLGIVPGVMYGLSAAGLFRAIKVVGQNS